MKTLLRLFPLCAFILLIQAQAQAQVYVGRVVDLSGNGIAGVSVNFRMTCFAGPGPNNPSTNVTNTFLTDTNGNFAGSYPNSSCQYGGPFSSLSVQKEGYYFGSIFRLGAELKVIGSNLPKIASVSAADYQPGMTSEMLAAGFDMGLSAETAIATQSPLPTSLSGKNQIYR